MDLSWAWLARRHLEGLGESSRASCTVMLSDEATRGNSATRLEALDSTWHVHVE
jgi:hypothetical protein